jgi:ketosteroid isomerase-like protein
MSAEHRAWSTGDVSDLKALEDSDVVYHMPGVDVRSWQAHEDFIVQGRQKIADLKQNWKYLSGEGNHFALAYDSSATLLGDDKKPASANTNSYLFFFRLKDQKIVEVWVNGSEKNTPIE